MTCYGLNHGVSDCESGQWQFNLGGKYGGKKWLIQDGNFISREMDTKEMPGKCYIFMIF